MPNNERKCITGPFSRTFYFVKEEIIMEKKVYQTSGVCARQITFDYENGKLYNLQFMGGCNGNLKAISKLCEGKDLAEIQSILKGNTCGMRSTSCADQLAKAISEVLK
jgi:uncharacterized protein (TIGR03905 family)